MFNSGKSRMYLKSIPPKQFDENIRKLKEQQDWSE